MSEFIRSYPFGKDDFFRHFVDEPLVLKIKPVNNDVSLKIQIHTNIKPNAADWHDLDFVEETKGEFALVLSDLSVGSYCFKMRYSTDNGLIWQWDQVPYSFILIDDPGIKGLSVYTLIPHLSGTISNWEAKLHEIKEMNFNSLLLLPVTQMDESRSPYAASDLFKIDPIYRNPNIEKQIEDQFQDFVDLAKRVEIKIGIDLVLNHIGIGSPLIKQHPEWFQVDPEEEDGIKRAGWWKGETWITWRDLALLHFEHPKESVRLEIWDYMVEYALHWANFAHQTDGFIRLDNFHSGHTDFMEFLLENIRKQYPKLIVLAEYFDDWEKIKRRVYNYRLDMILATQWEEKFVPGLRKLLKFLHQNYPQVRHFAPITSHDSGSPTQEFGKVEATFPRYILSTLFGIGSSGLVQGVEWGAPEKLGFIGDTCDLPDRPLFDFSSFIAKINQIVQKYSIFQKGGNLNFLNESQDAIISGLRMDQNKPAFLMLVNLDIHKSHAIEIDLENYFSDLEGSTLYDIFFKKRIKIEFSKIRFQLKPNGFRIMKIL